MNAKSTSSDENFFRKIVKAAVTEELQPALEFQQNNILRAIDKKNERLLEAIDQKNYNLRSDIAKMKDEIVGELKTVRQEQALLSTQHQRVLNHEERLEKLEKIHPQGHHISV